MDDATVEQLRDSIKKELKNHVYRSDDLHKNIFRADSYLAQIDDAKIIQFLNESELYNNDTQRWEDIPDSVDVDDPEPLGLAFSAIMTSVYEYFKYDKTRSVWLFHGDLLPKLTDMVSRPCITIAGYPGDNFVPDTVGNKEHLALRNCVSPVVVKTINTSKSFEDIVDASSYCRQTILSQQNRNFVYSLVLSEVFVQLYMFDRSGVCYSEEIGIHGRAVEFVRIILGVSSPDCAAVGFDTSIYWSNDCRWLNFRDDANQVRVYRIIDDQGKPYFNRDHHKILGRGTHCWRVVDENDNDLVVKDQWSANDLELEKEILECTKGLAGVSQMIAFQSRLSTDQMRGMKNGNNHPPKKNLFQNRSMIRTVYRYVGKPLTQFDSREEVLFALRDAIAGHQRLWERGILHRDISTNNILIGLPGSPVHWRGVLIDLDKAARLFPDKPFPMANFQAGTRKYQSVGVLRTHEHCAIMNSHDHLYDLESFFYCLCWIVWAYESSHTRVRPTPSHLDGWDGVPSASLAAKQNLLRNLEQYKTAPFFGKPFDTLVFEMGSYLVKQYSRKENMLKLDPSPFSYSDVFKAQAKLDYEYILGLFDAAADALETA